MSSFQPGQQVVYIDDFMPDTVETITSIEDEWVTFNKGSRGCIAAMVRLASVIEQNSGVRNIALNMDLAIPHKPEDLPFI